MGRVENESWYAVVAQHGSGRVFRAGQAINLQDELSEHVGIVISGRAKAVSFTQSGIETWLGYFSEGDFFGHISLLTDVPVNFEVTAEIDTHTLIIPVTRMKEILSENGQLSNAINKDLARRLDLMMRRLVEALTLSAKGRVCAELVRLSSPIGIDPKKQIIRPNPVFVELALRVSSTRETVSRTVSELQKKGIILREPGALVIPHPERLKAAVK